VLGSQSSQQVVRLRLHGTTILRWLHSWGIETNGGVPDYMVAASSEAVVRLMMRMRDSMPPQEAELVVLALLASMKPKDAQSFDDLGLLKWLDEYEALALSDDDPRHRASLEVTAVEFRAWMNEPWEVPLTSGYPYLVAVSTARALFRFVAARQEPGVFEYGGALVEGFRAIAAALPERLEEPA
jgi:hypothetical protein